MLWMLVLVAACGGDKDAGDSGHDGQDGHTSSTPPATTASGPASTPASPTSTASTPPSTTDTLTTPPYPGFTDLSWELHDEVRAFVEVSWTQADAETVHIEWMVDEGIWETAPDVDGVAGVNEQLIVGIPYGETAHWRVMGNEGSTLGLEIQTEDPPASLPVARVAAAFPDAWLQEGRYLLTSISEQEGGWSTSGPFWTVIFDRSGRPVWARTTGFRQWTLYATVAKAGDHILFDEFDSLFGDGNEWLYRSYLDEVIEIVPIPGFHHAFVEHEDGTLAWGSREHGGGEALVERAPGQSDETVVWTCNDNWPEAGWGYCASNCLWYEPSRNTYLYSFYSHETVVEIDRSTGDTLWWAGGVDGGYDFLPDYTQFYWQHGVSYTDTGTLLVSTHSRTGSTNLAREYVVDHDARALTEIWNYDAEALANTNGDTWKLANGNILHTLGSASQVKEVEPDGRVVWNLDFDSSFLMGRSEWITDMYVLLKP
jgi:hypothetical protein